MKKKIVISKTEILIFLLMFPFVKPNCLEVLFPLIDTLFDIGKFVSFCIIIIFTVNSWIHKSDTKAYLWILILLEVWIIFVTALNNPRSFLASVINGGSVVAVCLIIDYYAMRNPVALLKALMSNLGWVVYVNLLTQILVPEGLYLFRGNPCYFLGLNNSAIIYILPAFAISCLYFLCVRRSLRPILLILVSIVSIILGWCATSIVAMIAMVITWLFFTFKITRDKIKLLLIWIISVIIDLLITVTHIMESYTSLSNLIVTFLGKSTTLTGRVYIWDLALVYWAKSPAIGNGYYTTLPFEDSYVSHAHNAYLQYLLISGVVGLVIFILYNFLLIRRFDANCGTSKSGIVLKIAFSALFITYITEACNYPLLFSLYALAGSIPIFNSLEENKKMNPIFHLQHSETIIDTEG